MQKVALPYPDVRPGRQDPHDEEGCHNQALLRGHRMRYKNATTPAELTRDGGTVRDTQ